MKMNIKLIKKNKINNLENNMTKQNKTNVKIIIIHILQIRNHYLKVLRNEYLMKFNQ